MELPVEDAFILELHQIGRDAAAFGPKLTRLVALWTSKYSSSTKSKKPSNSNSGITAQERKEHDTMRSLAKQEIRNQEQSVRKERGHQAYSITSEPGGAEMFCAVMSQEVAIEGLAKVWQVLKAHVIQGMEGARRKQAHRRQQAPSSKNSLVQDAAGGGTAGTIAREDDSDALAQEQPTKKRVNTPAGADGSRLSSSGDVSRGPAAEARATRRARHGLDAGDQANVNTMVSNLYSKCFGLLLERVASREGFLRPPDRKTLELVHHELCQKYRQHVPISHLWVGNSNVAHFLVLRKTAVLRPKTLTWEATLVDLPMHLHLDLDRVTSLTIGRGIRQPLGGTWFPATRLRNLISLTLDDTFDQPMGGDVFPVTLQVLRFGDKFNKSTADMVFPRSLKKLQFGKAFNQPMARGILPPSLEWLEFHRHGQFNQHIDNVGLPDRMRHLSLGGRYNRSIRGPWLEQSKLTHLDLSKHTQNVYRVSWPRNLTDVGMGGLFLNRLKDMALPPSVVRMEFAGRFNQSLVGVPWPPNLEELHFRYCEFRRSLVRDIIRDDNDDIIGTGPVTLPDSLHTLSLGSLFDESLHGVTWPASLRKLSFGRGFTQELLNVAWPASLRHVTLPGPARATPATVNGAQITWLWT